jgi:hypothetical protein
MALFREKEAKRQFARTSRQLHMKVGMRGGATGSAASGDASAQSQSSGPGGSSGIDGAGHPRQGGRGGVGEEAWEEVVHGASWQARGLALPGPHFYPGPPASARGTSRVISSVASSPTVSSRLLWTAGRGHDVASLGFSHSSAKGTARGAASDTLSLSSSLQ